MNEARKFTVLALLAAIVPLIWFCFWYGLGNTGLLDNNEGIYAQVSLEMLESGNYVTPFFNGMPYLEKPPLLFWLTALSYKMFGISEFSARAIPALSASLLVVLAIWSGWRLANPLTGVLAGLILSSSVAVAILGRTLLFDMLLTLLLSACLIWIFCWLTTQQRHYALLAAAALGFAVLAKGLLPGVLMILTLGSYAYTARIPLSTLRRLLLNPWAIVLFLSITVPWHLAASIARDGFAHFYFVNEHIYRFLGIREPNDYFSGPVYYYMPRLMLYLAPWSVLLAYLFIRPINKARPISELNKFLWCWALSNLLFFSLSENKANYYAFVIALPLALLLAKRMHYWIMMRYEIGLWLLAITATGLTTLAVLGLQLTCSPSLNDLYPFCKEIHRHHALGFALLFGIALFGGLLRGRGWRRFAPVLILASLSLPLLNLGMEATRHYESKISQRRLATLMNTAIPAATVYVVNKLSDVSSLRFYLGRDIDIVDNDDADLYTGLRSPEGRGRSITMSKMLDLPKDKPFFVAVNPDHNDFKEVDRLGGLALFAETERLKVFLSTP